MRFEFLTMCGVALRAFPGKVDTDLEFTRDRHSMSPKSAKADLSGFPIGNATNIESRALSGYGLCNFWVNLNGKRSSVRVAPHQSALMFLSRTTRPQRASSSARNLPNSALEVGAGTAPDATSLSRTSGAS